MAQVPLNSLPVRIWRMLMSMNEMPKVTKMIAKIERNSMYVMFVTFKQSRDLKVGLSLKLFNLRKIKKN